MTAKATWIDPASVAGQIRAALDAIVWHGEADWTAARALLDATRTSNEGMIIAADGTVSDAGFWDDLLGDDILPPELEAHVVAPAPTAAPMPAATRARLRRQLAPRFATREPTAIENAIHAALAAAEDPEEDVQGLIGALRRITDWRDVRREEE